VAFLRKSGCRNAARLFAEMGKSSSANRVAEMRKSGFSWACAFLFLKRKVNGMDTGNQFLGTEHIGKLMGQYAVPCIISLLVGALYNIVDQIFIANANYLGSYGNAANTVVFPLTVVALAIVVMVGGGWRGFSSSRRV